MSLISPVAVLGAGSWGTALALLLARNGSKVRLWSWDSTHVNSMRLTRENATYLPGITFPSQLQIEYDLQACLDGVQDIFIVVPSSGFKEVLQKIAALKRSLVISQAIRVIWGTKGLDPQSGELLHQIVAQILGVPTPAAVISGPSFAQEVAIGLPTAVSLSGNNLQFVQDLIARLHGNNLRVYENSDFIGVQLCGVVKNILAIAVGIADGLQLGANSRCALITRGLAEMGRFNVALGGKSSTIMSLAGIGDLVLTCTDNQSRNRRLGLAIGQGKTVAQAQQEINLAIEGLNSTRCVHHLIKNLHIAMPITEQVYNVLYNNQDPRQGVALLLERERQVE